MPRMCQMGLYCGSDVELKAVKKKPGRLWMKEQNRNISASFCSVWVLSGFCLYHRQGQRAIETMELKIQCGPKQCMQKYRNKWKSRWIWSWITGKGHVCARAWVCACNCVCGLRVGGVILQRCEVITEAVNKVRTHTVRGNCVKHVRVRACVCTYAEG